MSQRQLADPRFPDAASRQAYRQHLSQNHIPATHAFAADLDDEVDRLIAKGELTEAGAPTDKASAGAKLLVRQVAQYAERQKECPTDRKAERGIKN